MPKNPFPIPKVFKRTPKTPVVPKPEVSLDTTTIKTYSILHEDHPFCRMRVVDKGGETIQFIGEFLPREYLGELINVLTKIRDTKEK